MRQFAKPALALVDSMRAAAALLLGAATAAAETAPRLAIFPGIAISLAVFGFNLFGDSLRDALDPKLRTV